MSQNNGFGLVLDCCIIEREEPGGIMKWRVSCFYLNGRTTRGLGHSFLGVGMTENNLPVAKPL